ncbi:MAG TPA: hypothetical protein DDZ41_11880 [Flavobacterium sp.]|nr:hypothetical protein [Flavobacterium sp.]
MFNSKNQSISDTLFDTLNFTVSVNYYFTIRNYPNTAKIYLVATGYEQRERISLNLSIPLKTWDKKKQRAKELNQKLIHTNLVIGQMETKIEKIKLNYLANDIILTPELLVKELKEDLSRLNFLAFFKQGLKREEKFMEKGSLKRHFSVYHKLSEYKEYISFNEIDMKFFDDFKIWCRKRGNAHTTIASNIASIKKFLKLAERDGIKLKINLEDIKAGSSRGNRTPLSLEETKRFLKYYYSGFADETERITLGYFLFSCMTGLRVSDVGNLERKNIIDNYISFISKKTKIDQIINLNDIALDIIKQDKNLFIKRVREQTMNKILKEIAKKMKIRKKITYHTSRHTFATLYLIAGGRIENLMQLLGHKKIETTMIYSHIVALEANKDVYRLDELFKKSGQ